MSDELRVMRWVVCLFFFFSFNIQAQESRVTLHLHEVKVEDALREVERQTGLSCPYESLLLQGLPPVSIDLDRVPLEDALDCILQGTWAAWTRLGDYIVLKRREEIDIPSDTLRNHQLQEILVEADSLRHNTGEEMPVSRPYPPSRYNVSRSYSGNQTWCGAYSSCPVSRQERRG